MSELDEIKWAASYNAYERLAANSNALENFLQPAWDEYKRTGQVPVWCGVDLLRGWAFCLYRSDYFMGGGSLGREWDDVLDALRSHPAATDADIPPQRERGTDA